MTHDTLASSIHKIICGRYYYPILVYFGHSDDLVGGISKQIYCFPGSVLEWIVYHPWRLLDADQMLSLLPATNTYLF